MLKHNIHVEKSKAVMVQQLGKNAGTEYTCFSSTHWRENLPVWGSFSLVLSNLASWSLTILLFINRSALPIFVFQINATIWYEFFSSIWLIWLNMVSMAIIHATLLSSSSSSLLEDYFPIQMSIWLYKSALPPVQGANKHSNYKHLCKLSFAKSILENL